MTTTLENRDKLLEIAMRQDGYFTSSQAKEAGYHTNNHSRLVASGQWIRMSWGVFRLASFPPSSKEDLVLVAFWSRSKGGSEPRCIFSHETALAFRNLGDFNPANIHIVLPEEVVLRSLSSPPLSNVEIIQENTPEDQWEVHGSINVVTALWAILQLLARGNSDPDMIREAFLDGIKTRVIDADIVGAVMSGGILPKGLNKNAAIIFLTPLLTLQ